MQLEARFVRTISYREEETHFFAHAASPEVRLVCQQKVLGWSPSGGSPARLSSQFPGCATPLLQRRMMLVDSEAPAQKSPPVAGHMYADPLLLCKTLVAIDSCCFLLGEQGPARRAAICPWILGAWEKDLQTAATPDGTHKVTWADAIVVNAATTITTNNIFTMFLKRMFER